MNSIEIKRFIHKNSNLLRYIPDDKKEDITHELLLETILKYGALDDVKELFNIMGINQAAIIFNGLKGRKKINYYPEIYNFFSLNLKKYASGNIESRTK